MKSLIENLLNNDFPISEPTPLLLSSFSYASLLESMIS
ncbi:hypothetical protein EU94_0626 [Prochlorococcus marinus str. MIT 9123]|uniref:Uncharacterized protein n=1 Tax=Prochlorococcus marinus str. MIT 9116 TaxID=167544 RepID=A0A0A1ZRI5_PROMR|nr:hypothetical protein EU93_0747 [Prochlorococcus marinus str. MIT 9116]KGF94281.1 hypothetical protein EU94_0626 [Prochlorococcus marinus str. MIT 9123]